MVAFDIVYHLVTFNCGSSVDVRFSQQHWQESFEGECFASKSRFDAFACASKNELLLIQLGHFSTLTVNSGKVMISLDALRRKDPPQPFAWFFRFFFAVLQLRQCLYL